METGLFVDCQFCKWDLSETILYVLEISALLLILWIAHYRISFKIDTTRIAHLHGKNIHTTAKSVLIDSTAMHNELEKE